MPFKKRRTPQLKLRSEFFLIKPTINATYKVNSLVSSRTFKTKLSVFFKQILKLKFFLKFFLIKQSKVYANAMVISLQTLKTKNARMGKGKGPTKVFFICFFPQRAFITFLGKSSLFFTAFASFLQKRLFQFFFFCF